MPAISTVLRYPPVTGSNVFLSSGGIYSGHADCMDGWKANPFAELVQSCLNRYVNRCDRPRLRRPLDRRGNTLRVVVTATNLAGSSNAASVATWVVADIAPPPPPVMRRNRAPSLS
ncbi:MAG TPA: hypothetical protein VLV28_08700 [Gaiellaceae bacterium]|nr:hypothetical protein [Gaiellaceae bacterium]